MLNDFNFLAAEFFYFKIVYELGSINGAARKIGQDPANISRMIAKLEAGLGAKLFVRHKAGLNPTELGDRVYAAVSAAQSGFAGSLEGQESRRRRIRIGFSATIGYTHFSEKMIQGLLEMNFAPEFTLKSSSELVEMIKSRELDFMLIHDTLKFPGLISRKIGVENLVLCGLGTGTQKTLLLHPDMLGMEKVITSLSYEQRWMIKDYFVIAKMLSSNPQLMGVLPESLLQNHKALTTLRTFEGAGRITCVTWSGSVGVELIKWIARDV